MTRSGAAELAETSPNGSATRPADGRVPAADSQTAWRLPLAVLIAGMFMSILDLSIINVALPTIQDEFGAAQNDAQWVTTGYSLAEGVVVPVSAWMGDRFGVSRVYNMALLGFVAGSALCGLAWSLNSLVVSRVIQGLLGGILPAITMTIILRIVPRESLGTALGFFGLGALFAPAAGPALGGYLVEYASWRLIFYINVPIGILGAVAATLLLPRFPGVARRPFDFLGFAAVATSLFTLLLALSKGEDWDWNSYPIMILFAVSALSMASFIVIELEIENPLLDLRVFRYTAFTHSLVLIAFLALIMFAVVLYVPQFLQRGQGLGAFHAGLILLAPALVMAILMPLSGKIYDRFGPRWPTATGGAIAAAGCYLLSTITLDSSRGQITWMLLVLYTGLGLGMMPIYSSGLAVIPPAYGNVASAFNNLVQRCSGALGTAACTAILTIQEAQLTAGRYALLPDNTSITVPKAGPNTTRWQDLYSTYQQTDLRVYTGAINNLFTIFAGLCVLVMLGAFLMRSGPAPAAAPENPAPARKATASPASTTSEVATTPPEHTPDHHTGAHHTGNTRTAGSGSPARQANGQAQAETEVAARPPDT